MSDRHLNYIAILLLGAVFVWLFSKDLPDTQPNQTFELENAKVGIAAREFAKTESAQIVTQGGIEAVFEAIDEDPEKILEFVEDAEAFLEQSTGRSNYLADHDSAAEAQDVLSFRRAAKRQGWIKFEPANYSEIDRAKQCTTRFARGFINLDRFKLKQKNLRPEWLYVEPGSSSKRFAAMAHAPLRAIGDVDFVLFRLDDCQLVQVIGQYGLTSIRYSVEGHDHWLSPAYEVQNFLTAIHSDRTNAIEIFVHPGSHLVRSISIEARLAPNDIRPNLKSFAAERCVEDLLVAAQEPRTIKTKKFNIVSELPARTCFSWPIIDVEAYDLSMSEMPIMLRKDETIADMQRRIKRSTMSLDELFTSMMDSARHGSVPRVDGFASTIDLNLSEAPK